MKDLDKFFQLGDWIPATDKLKETGPYRLLWDDFEAVKALLEKHPKLFVYTLVDEDGGWIVKGLRYVNRMGYFLSKVEVPLNEAIMYYPPDGK